MRRKTHANASHPSPAIARANRCLIVIECESSVSSPIVHSEQYGIFMGGSSRK